MNKYEPDPYLPDGENPLAFTHPQLSKSLRTWIEFATATGAKTNLAEVDMGTQVVAAKIGYNYSYTYIDIFS